MTTPFIVLPRRRPQAAPITEADIIRARIGRLPTACAGRTFGWRHGRSKVR